MKQEQRDALRAPFPKEQIQKLPTGGLQLDYVSHAWVTDRLLQVDPTWTWEPVAFDADGLPKFDENGGLWIKLTVCGVTRYGYGEPQGRDKFDARKGAISNALRVAACRFGVALDLWAKEAPAENTKLTPYAKSTSKATKDLSTATQKMIERINTAGSLVELSKIVPLIQGGEFTEDEKRNLRLIFNNKKTELGA
jgi:hypothetical protein